MPPLEKNLGDYEIDPHLRQNIINKAHIFEPGEDPTENSALRRKIADLEKIAFEAQIRANESDAEVINLNAQLDYVEQKHKDEKRILNAQLDNVKQKHMNDKKILNTQLDNLEQKHNNDKKILNTQLHKVEQKYKNKKQTLNSQLYNAEQKLITEKKETEQKHKTEKNGMLVSFDRVLEAEAKKVIMLKDQHKKAMETTQVVVMKLKAALKFTVRKKDEKIKELNRGFGEEKKKMIQCYNEENIALQNKNRDRNEIISEKIETLLKFF